VFAFAATKLHKLKVITGRAMGKVRPSSCWFLCLAYSSTAKMATYSSETSVDFQWTTCPYIPEESTLESKKKKMGKRKRGEGGEEEEEKE
jgi:hypothetical protein